MAEAVWNGSLRLSLVSCTIHLSPAVNESKRIKLERLSARTGNPVTEQFVDAKTGDVVTSEALVRGYQFESSRYITVSEEEIAKFGGGGANIIDLEHFVPRHQIDQLHIDDTYYIHPDGQLAADTVHALRVAMQRSGRAALGHVWIGDSERPVLIEPHRGGLMMSTLRTADEVVHSDFVERAENDVPGDMIEIAESIIARRAGDFDAALLRDRFQDDLRELVDQKIKGLLPGPAEAAPAEGRRRRLPRPDVPPAPEPPPEPEPVLATPPPPPEPPPVPEPPPQPEPVLAVPPPPEPEPVLTAPPPIPEPPPPPEPPAEPTVTVVETEHVRATLVQERPEHTREAAAEEPPAPEPEPVPEPEPTPESPPAAAGPQDIGAEILLHIMSLGDRRYVEPGWAPNTGPGSKKQIEAISIRPRDGLTPSAIEFRVFAQEGRATAWVSNGNYAGTRGRNLPLTGFAVRPSPGLGERLEITYEGSFIQGGVVGPKRNGELCESPVADDPLEAVRVTILDQGAGE